MPALPPNPGGLGQPSPPSDPYVFYSAIRTQGSPLWSSDLKSWLVFDHQMIKDGLLNSHFSSFRSRIDRMPTEKRDQLVHLRRFYQGWLMFMDGAVHEATRSALSRAMSSDVLSQAVEESSRRSISILTGAITIGQLEIVEHYATPVANTAIARLIGIPGDSVEYIHTLSSDIVRFLGQPEPSLELGLDAQLAAQEIVTYLDRLVQSKEYLDVSILSNLFGESSQVRLPTREGLLMALANVLVDGHDPVIAALVNSLVTLDELGFLLEPQGLPTVRTVDIEEALRLNPPFQYVSRVAAQDTVIGDQAILAGQRVVFFIAAGNRDESTFESPNNVCPNHNPNLHLSFGAGPHYCIGAKLARLMLRRMLDHLTMGLPGLRLHNESISWVPSWGYRFSEALLVQWTPPETLSI